MSPWLIVSKCDRIVFCHSSLYTLMELPTAAGHDQLGICRPWGHMTF